MARLTFGKVFIQHPDGTLEPRKRIRIGGVSLGPGVRFSTGAKFAGVDFTLFIGRDFDAQEENGVLVINGIYQ